MKLNNDKDQSSLTKTNKVHKSHTKVQLSYLQFSQNLGKFEKFDEQLGI